MSEYVKKIKFADGSIKYVYDTGAPRIEDLDNYLPISGGTIDGDLEVTGTTQVGSIKVDEVEFIPINTEIDNVLVHGQDGSVSKRSTDKLLEDIGGVSYAVDDEHGILSFNIGKNN